MRQIAVIAHDIRSAHNVGSLLRTADGFGVHVFLTGYTPYPKKINDTRLPHLSEKLTKQIHKTALGAEIDYSLWTQQTDIEMVLTDLQSQGYEVIALEQAQGSIALPDYQPGNKVAFLLGRELEGVDKSLVRRCDRIVEIPMLGRKESFNVIESATAAMYHCRFFTK